MSKRSSRKLWGSCSRTTSRPSSSCPKCWQECARQTNGTRSRGEILAYWQASQCGGRQENLDMDRLANPYGLKNKLIWSNNMMRLNDISRYFNMGNKKQTYQASWICNIMAFWEVLELLNKPTKEKENDKEKNPKWKVSAVLVDRLKHGYLQAHDFPWICFFIICHHELPFAGVLQLPCFPTWF